MGAILRGWGTVNYMSRTKAQGTTRRLAVALVMLGLFLIAGCSSLSSGARSSSSTTTPLYAYGTLPRPTTTTRHTPATVTPQTGPTAPPTAGYSTPPSPAQQLKKLGYPPDAKYINVSDHRGVTIGVVAASDILLTPAGSPPYPSGKPGYLVLDTKNHATVVGYFTHDLGFVSIQRTTASLAELRDCLAKKSSHPDCIAVVAQYAAYG